MSLDTVFYSAVGAELTTHAVDVPHARLDARSTVTTAADVQFAAADRTSSFLYVVGSDGGPGSRVPGDTHVAAAYRIDPQTGALAEHGEPAMLSSRPIHCCVDHANGLLLCAYNHPSAVTVHRIRGDGAIGPQVEQRDDLGCGVYAHHVRATPRSVLLVTRGNDAEDGRPEDPGSIEVMDVTDGVLRNRVSVAPGGGRAFRPRQLDLHPSGSWAFVSVESQNELHVYALLPDGSLGSDPLFVTSTLANQRSATGQMAGPIHVHPTGRWVYMTNRNSETSAADGVAAVREGENNVVVFAIDQATGQPSLVGHADPCAVHLRTLSIHPGGRLLVTASIEPAVVHDRTDLVETPARLSVFRIGDDGVPELARTYDVDTGQALQFWSGMVELPTGPRGSLRKRVGP
jgi:6-phosphogluconolactonase